MGPILDQADAVLNSEQARALINNGTSGVLLAADATGKLSRIIVNDPIIGRTSKGTLAVKRDNLLIIASFIMQIAEEISEEEHTLVAVDINLGVGMKKVKDSDVATTTLTLTISLWNKFVASFPLKAPRTSDFRILSQQLGYLWA